MITRKTNDHVTNKYARKKVDMYRVYAKRIVGKKKKRSISHFFEATSEDKVYNKLAQYYRKTKDGDTKTDWSLRIYKY